MKTPTTCTNTAGPMTHTPPERAARAFLRTDLRQWQAVAVGALSALGLWLAVPSPAAACSWYDPACWIEEGVDHFTDLAKDLGNLVKDVVTIDPEGVFDDLVDIGENIICGHLTVADVIGGNVAEALHNDQCAPPHGIPTVVLNSLRSYFTSDFTSVVIHQDCQFTEPKAITIGEHIYFSRRAYQPRKNGRVYPDGFALLAHELTHVLQYRRDGFGDFVCKYWATCGVAATFTGTRGVSCDYEQQAYTEHALVLEDIKRDGDGVFSCELDNHEWNADNVGDHSCTGKPLLDNCPDTSNRDQYDTDRDGVGDACDPGRQCTEGATKHVSCRAPLSGEGYAYKCKYGYWRLAGGEGCKKVPQGGRPR